MDLSNILLGLVTAAFLIHLRGAYLLAEKQRLAAIRLHAYLMYWQNWVLENNVFSVFQIGAEWNRKIKEQLAQGKGAKELVALEAQQKREVYEIEQALKSGSLFSDLEKIKQEIARLPSNSIDNILRYSERFEQNLFDGKTFLSDEEASVLGPHYARLCIDLKMHMTQLTSKAMALVISAIAAPDDFSLEKKAREITDAVWIGVLVSKDIDYLASQTGQARTQSILSRTWKNLWS